MSPDALAGRSLLEAGLARVAPAARAAFYEAVQRCYASAAEDEPPSDGPAAAAGAD